MFTLEIIPQLELGFGVVLEDFLKYDCHRSFASEVVVLKWFNHT